MSSKAHEWLHDKLNDSKFGITKVSLSDGSSFLRITDQLSSGYTGLARFLWHEIYPEEMKQYDQRPCMVLGNTDPGQQRYNIASVLFSDGSINDAVHIMTLRAYREQG